MAAVGTPMPLPAPPDPWRCSARQRPGRRRELCRRPPPSPTQSRHRRRAPGDAAADRGHRAGLPRPDAAPGSPHRHHHAPGLPPLPPRPQQRLTGRAAALGLRKLLRRLPLAHRSNFRPPLGPCTAAPGCSARAGAGNCATAAFPPRAQSRHRRSAPGDVAADRAGLPRPDAAPG